MAQNLKLFVNYRRADEALFVQLMRTHFMYRYGRENVFMDFDTIPPFTLFEDFIRQKVRDCDALVAVIGPRWLELMQEKEAEGKPDYVRIEIEEALENGKIVAPICIQGGSVPPLEQIPDHLRVIFDRNVPELQAGRHILDNIQRIMEGLEGALADQGTRRNVANPVEDEGSAETIDIRVARRQFFEARSAGNLPEALVWLARMRESGANLPKSFHLEHYETEIQILLKKQEDERRQLEVAEYLYSFVRDYVEFNEPVEVIRAALADVWEVMEGYDPDGYAAGLEVQAPVVKIVSTPDNYLAEITAAVKVVLPEPFEWCEIPAGPFLMGSDRTKDKQAYDDEPDLHELTLPTFYMAKYPVTYAQYEVFVNGDGYTNRDYWTQAGWAWKADKRHPEYLWNDAKWHIPDHPVVGVTWYEAYAFSQWLSAKVGYEVRLPTEAEWEKAARGRDGRIYPYGNEFDPKKANVRDTGIGKTCPVTDFPDGQSPYGVMGMSGNVWDWCLSNWTSPYQHHVVQDIEIENTNRRVLRGGSWDLNLLDTRAAYRDGDYPGRSQLQLRFSLCPLLLALYTVFCSLNSESILLPKANRFFQIMATIGKFEFMLQLEIKTEKNDHAA